MAAYLDWLAVARRGLAGARHRRSCATTSRSSATGRATIVRRPAAGRAPPFHRYAAKSGIAPGDPWGAIATPRLPRRLPRVLEVDQVERLIAVVEADLDAADAGTGRRHDPDGTRAIALRDRALVETAYAAGLRISELAAADLGSLDLRRGEVRVLGKGRKERIGLLGRPAREALEAYLAEGRPVARGAPVAAR